MEIFQSFVGKVTAFQDLQEATSEIVPFWPSCRFKPGNAGNLYRLWILVGENFVGSMGSLFTIAVFGWPCGYAAEDHGITIGLR